MNMDRQEQEYLLSSRIGVEGYFPSNRVDVRCYTVRKWL